MSVIETRAHFEPHVGTIFVVATAQGVDVDIVLEEVIDLSHQAPPPEVWTRDPFTLVFRGPAGVSLDQGLYDVLHPTLGALAIFLVPASAATAALGASLEAHYN